MTSELDTYRSAKIHVHIHGDPADMLAAQMVEKMAGQNYEAGVATWKWILVAVDELRADAPSRGIPYNRNNLRLT